MTRWIHVTLCSLTVTMGTTAAFAVDIGQLRVPDGFRISVLVQEVDGARQLALGPDGTLYIGSLRTGNVYAVPEALTLDTPVAHVIAQDLTLPSGVALRDGALYVAALDRILVYRDIATSVHAVRDGRAPEPPEILADDLPDVRHHGWKYLTFGPAIDDRPATLFVPVGAPCNICESDDPRFASILAMNPETGEAQPYAHGVRNSVGMAIHPKTGALWFTDNGRDLLGDDIPPEEINRTSSAGGHFGYPYVHATDVVDPEFGETATGKQVRAQFEQPVVEVQAHSALLGIDFYSPPTATRAFPATYRDALFVAEHGSWNRTSKVGYRVSVLQQRADGALAYSPFVTGWLQGEDAWGRPNDVLVTPDGSLLISDDEADAVYRVTYQGSSREGGRRQPAN